MFTPIDIQNHSLKTAVRGYSKKETDDFLEEILKSYEELYKENRDLKDKVSSLSEGIQYYKNMEATLQKALVLAEKTSSETQEAAKSRADSLMSEAETKATALQKEAEAEIEALRKETEAYSEVTRARVNQELAEARNHVRKLVRSYENYRLQFKRLAESQIEMLESEHYKIFEPELSEMLSDAPTADEAMEKGEYTKNIHVIENEGEPEYEGGQKSAVQEQVEEAVPVPSNVPIPDTVPLPVEELNAIMAEAAEQAKISQEVSEKKPVQLETPHLEGVQTESFKTVVPQTEEPKAEEPRVEVSKPSDMPPVAAAPQKALSPSDMPPVAVASQKVVSPSDMPPVAAAPQKVVSPSDMPPAAAPQKAVSPSDMPPAAAPQMVIPQVSQAALQPQAETAPNIEVQTAMTPQAPQTVAAQPVKPPVAQVEKPQNVVSQSQPKMPQSVGLTADDMPPVFSGGIPVPQMNQPPVQPVPVPQVKTESPSVPGRQLTADDMPPIPSADDMPPVFPAATPKAEAAQDSPFTFIDTE